MSIHTGSFFSHIYFPLQPLTSASPYTQNFFRRLRIDKGAAQRFILHALGIRRSRAKKQSIRCLSSSRQGLTSHLRTKSCQQLRVFPTKRAKRRSKIRYSKTPEGSWKHGQYMASCTSPDLGSATLGHIDGLKKSSTDAVQSGGHLAPYFWLFAWTWILTTKPPFAFFPLELRFVYPNNRSVLAFNLSDMRSASKKGGPLSNQPGLENDIHGRTELGLCNCSIFTKTSGGN